MEEKKQMITAVCFYRMFMKTHIPSLSRPAAGRPSGAGARE
jgi:hypothetical protein